MNPSADSSHGAIAQPAIAADRDVTNTGNMLTGNISGDVIFNPVIQAEVAASLPECPPEIVGFVGRDAEFEQCHERLRAAHFVVITGMPGVGKTALAVKLAQKYATIERVFWHTFRSGEDIQIIISYLAAFLAHNGQPELWRKLQAERQAGREPLSAELHFSDVFGMIRGRNYLLCLDALDCVSKESLPLVGQLVERLRGLVATGQVAVIVTAQRKPAFLSGIESSLLNGLNREDAERWLAVNKTVLSAEIFESLCRRTEGNAQLLLLAGNALRGKGQQEQIKVIEQLAKAEDITLYLTEAAHVRLTEEEGCVMNAVAALMGQPGTAEAIWAILKDINAQRTLPGLAKINPIPILEELAARHLLTVTHMEGAQQYSQHALVQSFYYGRLDPDQRSQFHLNAAAFYGGRGKDALRAAIHCEYAEDYEQAAALATRRDTWDVIRHGQGATLQHLLSRLEKLNRDKEIELTPVSAARVALAQGQLQQYGGGRKRAAKYYTSAFALAGTQPKTPEICVLTARICRSMGDLWQFEDYGAAQKWLESGLQILVNYDSGEEAALRVVLGSVLIARGDLDGAQAQINQGLARLPEDPGSTRIDALISLSTIHSWQGDLAAGKTYSQQALEASEEIHDQFGILKALNNLGLISSAAGNWPEAVTSWQRALDLARRIGHRQRQAELANNLGLLDLKLGDEDAALEHLTTALTLAQAQDLAEYELAAQLNLAQLHLRQRCLANATVAHAEAMQQADKLQARPFLPEVYRVAAQIALARGDRVAAHDHISQSLTVARELGQKTEEGASLRVLGQILAATGKKVKAARDAFERSLAAIGPSDPYETARTQADFGAFLLRRGDTPRGESLRDAAQATFAQLGVKDDSSRVNPTRAD